MTTTKKPKTLTLPPADSTYSVTVEKLGAVKARQVIWTTRDAEATAGLPDDALVNVVRNCTPFGIFLLAVSPA